jgi:hypothetical protein
VSENLDLVCSIYATRERGELDWWAHAEIVVVSADGPQPGTLMGLDGLAEALRTWRDAWEDFRAEPEDFRALSDGRVLVLIRRSGRGEASGI